MLLKKLEPRIVWSFETEERMVALTIDDSPSENTEAILDILAQHNASATFFVIGNQIAASTMPVLQRILRSGCEIGNHTWSNKMSALLSIDAFDTSYSDTRQRIGEIENDSAAPFPRPFAQRLQWFRPGCGFWKKSIIDYVSRLDHVPVLGTLYPFDAEIRMPCFAVSHILHHLHPGGIIILHDRKHTLTTLRLLLPELAIRGYRVLSLSGVQAAATTLPRPIQADL